MKSRLTMGNPSYLYCMLYNLHVCVKFQPSVSRYKIISAYLHQKRKEKGKKDMEAQSLQTGEKNHMKVGIYNIKY